MSELGRTRLSQEDVDKLRSVVGEYLKTHECITNRQIRAETNINYDQAIFFFNLMLECKFLIKHGRGSGTRYVLAESNS